MNLPLLLAMDACCNVLQVIWSSPMMAKLFHGDTFSFILCYRVATVSLTLLVSVVGKILLIMYLNFRFTVYVCVYMSLYILVI